MTTFGGITLDRPLVWLDCETHDTCPPEQQYICEFGFRIIYPDDRPIREWNSYIQPPVGINPRATEVHGISDSHVVGSPRWVQIAANLAKGFEGCDYGGYHVHFDLRVIAAEMKRANIAWSYENARVLDGLRIRQIKEPRTLSDSVRQILKREPRDAHRALTDALDAMDVVEGLLALYPDLPRNMQELHDLCFFDPDAVDPEKKFVWRSDQVVVNFGKWYGEPLTSQKREFRGYLQWMIDKGNFSDKVKTIAAAALRGEFPQRVQRERNDT
jgi:DNA polymerase III epsilon subunit-like protein